MQDAKIKSNQLTLCPMIRRVIKINKLNNFNFEV